MAVNASFLMPFLNYMKIGGIKVTKVNTYSYIQSEGYLGVSYFPYFLMHMEERTELLKGQK